MITNTAAYEFVTIQDPQTLAVSVLAQAEQQALKGSVLIAEEGINLFLAGDAEQISAFYALAAGRCAFCADADQV